MAMTIARKPVMASPPPSGPDPAPLPYPVSPSSPKLQYANAPPRNEETHDKYLGTPSPYQNRSHNSSVSDLSDSWFDSDFDDEDAQVGKSQSHPAPAPPKEPELPNTLKAGTRHAESDRSASQNTSGLDVHGLDRLNTPQVPATLQVTPPPTTAANNPFHVSKSLDDERSDESSTNPIKDTDFWADMTGGPYRNSPSPQPSSLPDVSNLSLSTAPIKQYRPYSPAAGADNSHQHSNSLPIVEPPPDRPLELPASPVEDKGHLNTENDVYSGLAEMDATPPAPARPPPLPTRQPPTVPEPEQLVEAMPSLGPDLKGKGKVEENLIDTQSNPISDKSVSEPPNPWPTDVKVEPDQSIDAPPRMKTPPQRAVEIPLEQANRQRAETYRIKQVRWVDSSSPNIRSSPIMVQNANGPCPLLALVNALTLSTPAGLETALIETLKSREQVSLGLLLDAVFDELMSGRRGDAAQQLPDVGELYSFLLTLHTGMNVNPRFVPPPKESTNLIDGFDTPRSPSFDDQRPPGGFEDTREMKLYGTFAVPLVHGWLPPRTHPAYAALTRSATTYEDAQNLMFREEELEGKLQRGGLSTEEQQLLEDIATVKYFLSSSSTQLTSYGLDVVTDSMIPGSICILFRNDHFSTLYKHPRSGQLLTLVTDEGYSTHDEVVWESLVDVSGESCEFYSGDFRPVGFGGPSAPPPAQESAAHDEKGWSTVSRSAKKGVATYEPAAGPSNAQHGEEYNISAARNTEQEDADLALAMQLQEEEEDRQRRETEARQREEEAASQAFISQEVANPAQRESSRRNPQTYQHPANQALNNLTAQRQAARATRGNAAGQRGGRGGGVPPARTGAAPAPPPRERDPEAGEDTPPPTYEQAAQATPYHGPVPSSSSSDSYAAMRASNAANRDPYTRSRGMSAYSQHRATMPGQPPPNPSAVRRTASGADSSIEAPVAQVRRERERDKDCIVM